MTKITPVLMSGGAGTRLWPLSRRDRPKQFHPMGGANTLIQDTALRVVGDLFGPPIILASDRHLELVREQMAAIGVAPKAILLEPAGRNTGPAAAAAAAYAALEDPDAILLLIHADNRVSDVAALHRAVEAGLPAAAAGALVLFGLTPTGPETGYGYIKAGPGVGDVRPVEGFKEKPDLETAKIYVADPAYSWNGGMFLFNAGLFLAEMRRFEPLIAEAAEQAVRDGVRDGEALTLSDAFLAAPAEAIDTAIFERTDRAMVVATDIGWSDVGAWDAMWSGSPKDAAGNSAQGPMIAANSADCLTISDGPPIVLAGVEGLVVIAENGVILVARREDALAMRAAVAALKDAGRDDLL